MITHIHKSRCLAPEAPPAVFTKVGKMYIHDVDALEDVMDDIVVEVENDNWDEGLDRCNRHIASGFIEIFTGACLANMSEQSECGRGLLRCLDYMTRLRAYSGLVCGRQSFRQVIFRSLPPDFRVRL